jgi:hypothetical protein
MMVQIQDDVGEELRELKYELSFKFKKTMSFTKTIKFLIEYYRENEARKLQGY